VDARFEELETQAITVDARTEFEAKNLVVNGDFSNGDIGWAPTSATLISSINKELIFIVTSPNGRYGQSFTHILGNKYYYSGYVKATSSNVKFDVAGVILKAHSGSGNYEFLSGTWTATGNSSFPISARDYRTSGWDNVSQKYIAVIDLTATFGAGKEPTLAEMDRLMARFPNSWFDGTKPIQTIETLYQEKANKVQEAWITPTLVNSWVAFDTRTAKYKKADYGRVYLKGVVKNGTIGATIFTLPTGYRPDEALIFGVITVNVDGTVVCTSGVNTSVSLSGVNFFV